LTPLVLQGETNLGELGINTLQSRYATTSSSPECERNGTCTYLLPFNIFVAFQHRVGWQHVEVTEHRTNADFARWL
jgi:hypothetical protein